MRIGVGGHRDEQWHLWTWPRLRPRPCCLSHSSQFLKGISGLGAGFETREQSPSLLPVLCYVSRCGSHLPLDREATFLFGMNTLWEWKGWLLIHLEETHESPPPAAPQKIQAGIPGSFCMLW